MKHWYNLSGNENSKTADIYLWTEIDNWFGIGKEQFKNTINSSGAANINLHISSPGGNVDDALAMYDYLRNYPGMVTAKLTGVVASSATIVALGADKVEMSEASFFMIHNPWCVAIGDADEMRKTAELADKFKDRLVAVYKRKTNSKGKNLKATQISKWMDDETWMTADEALANGFVDSKTDNEKNKLKNSIDVSKLRARGFLNIPMEKINTLNQNSINYKMKAKDYLREILDRLGGGRNDNKGARSPEEIPEAHASPEEKFNGQISDLANKVNEKENEIASLKEKISTFENDIRTRDNEIARLQGKSTATAPSSDPEGPNAGLNEAQKKEAQLANVLDIDMEAVQRIRNFHNKNSK